MWILTTVLKSTAPVILRRDGLGLQGFRKEGSRKKLKDHSIYGHSMSKGCKEGKCMWFVNIMEGRKLRDIR